MKTNHFFTAVRKRRARIFFALLLPVLCLAPAAVTARAAAAVTLSASPALQTVTAGQSADYAIKIGRDGYGDKVTLSAAGLPAGTAAVFAPNQTSAGSSVLTLKTSPSTPAGMFSVTVKGSAPGVVIAPVTVSLEVRAAAASVEVSIAPAARDIIAGQTAVFDVTVKRREFSGPVALTAENLPSGVSAVFEPDKTNGDSSKMYLFSSGLPHLPADFTGTIRVTAVDRSFIQSLTFFRARINCGIYWVEQFALPDNQAGNSDFLKTVAADRAGFVYAAGESVVSSTDLDVFVTKYDSSTGGQVWTRRVVFPALQEREDRATDIAVDAAGSVYVAGYRQNGPAGRVNFDIFIAKFDAAGNQVGNPRTLGGAEEDGAAGMEIAFDGPGGVVLTAVTDVFYFYVAGGTLGQNRYTTAQYRIRRYVLDANLVQTNAGGDIVVQQITGYPRDLTVGSDGSIYTVGDVPRVVSPNPPIDNDFQAYLTRHSSAGMPTGHIEFSLPNNSPGAWDFARRVAVDNTGNVFVAGYSDDNDFQATKRTWLTRHNAGNLSIAWQQSEAHAGADTVPLDLVENLAVDANNELYATGYRNFRLLPSSDSETNPPSASPRFTSYLDSNAFLKKIAGASGALLYRKEFDVANKDSFQAMTIDYNGDLLLAGSTVAFAAGYGFEDALLMKYSVRDLARCALF